MSIGAYIKYEIFAKKPAPKEKEDTISINLGKMPTKPKIHKNRLEGDEKNPNLSSF